KDGDFRRARPRIRNAKRVQGRRTAEISGQRIAVAVGLSVGRQASQREGGGPGCATGRRSCGPDRVQTELARALVRHLQGAVQLAAAALILTLAAARPVGAYSVLAHESNIDVLWDTQIRPLLHDRFPRASYADLQRARAYAYGGSVIQDLGYYPFGSHLFTNLVHYVKTGDFVQA